MNEVALLIILSALAIGQVAGCVVQYYRMKEAKKALEDK